MNPTSRVKAFLSNATDISLGYNEINFVQPNILEKEQVGYAIDPEGNSLITGDEGGWQEQWLVIASDHLGDPIIVDLSSPDLTVLTAAHGEGFWEPFIIADSLDNYSNIISILKVLSKGRSYPEDLKRNPISEEDRKEILTKIEKQNVRSEIWYWECLFED